MDQWRGGGQGPGHWQQPNQAAMPPGGRGGYGRPQLEQWAGGFPRNQQHRAQPSHPSQDMRGQYQWNQQQQPQQQQQLNMHGQQQAPGAGMPYGNGGQYQQHTPQGQWMLAMGNWQQPQQQHPQMQQHGAQQQQPQYSGGYGGCGGCQQGWNSGGRYGGPPNGQQDHQDMRLPSSPYGHAQGGMTPKGGMTPQGGTTPHGVMSPHGVFLQQVAMQPSLQPSPEGSPTAASDSGARPSQMSPFCMEAFDAQDGRPLVDRWAEQMQDLEDDILGLGDASPSAAAPRWADQNDDDLEDDDDQPESYAEDVHQKASRVLRQTLMKGATNNGANAGGGSASSNGEGAQGSAQRPRRGLQLTQLPTPGGRLPGGIVHGDDDDERTSNNAEMGPSSGSGNSYSSYHTGNSYNAARYNSAGNYSGNNDHFGGNLAHGYNKYNNQNRQYGYNDHGPPQVPQSGMAGLPNKGKAKGQKGGGSPMGKGADPSANQHALAMYQGIGPEVPVHSVSMPPRQPQPQMQANGPPRHAAGQKGDGQAVPPARPPGQKGGCEQVAVRPKAAGRRAVDQDVVVAQAGRGAGGKGRKGGDAQQAAPEPRSPTATTIVRQPLTAATLAARFRNMTDEDTSLVRAGFSREQEERWRQKAHWMNREECQLVSRYISGLNLDVPQRFSGRSVDF